MTTLVFVHGWSVTDTPPPTADAAAAAAAGRRRRSAADAADVWLSEYVSFDDAVTMADLVRAFDHALRDLHLLDASFACVTHSTGGPVVREWLRSQRERPGSTQHHPPQSSGDAGAGQLRLGAGPARQGHPGSSEILVQRHRARPAHPRLAASWAVPNLCRSTSISCTAAIRPRMSQFLFVLIGDRPDRALYDHLNSYTGEDGSDGVVRIAAANLNARHAVLSLGGGRARRAGHAVAES